MLITAADWQKRLKSRSHHMNWTEAELTVLFGGLSPVCVFVHWGSHSLVLNYKEIWRHTTCSHFVSTLSALIIWVARSRSVYRKFTNCPVWWGQDSRILLPKPRVGTGPFLDFFIIRQKLLSTTRQSSWLTTSSVWHRSTTITTAQEDATAAATAAAARDVPILPGVLSWSAFDDGIWRPWLKQIRNYEAGALSRVQTAIGDSCV